MAFSSRAHGAKGASCFLRIEDASRAYFVDESRSSEPEDDVDSSHFSTLMTTMRQAGTSSGVSTSQGQQSLPAAAKRMHSSPRGNLL
ncbi:hypothetical protein MTO96_031908 [Rhipicephalus appendiculatus]